MKTYRERTGREPDFLVRYRFLTEAEGGRRSPPHQHTRWDFMYEGDDPTVGGISMIWPEFVNESGASLPIGEVPAVGRAIMFIVDVNRRPFHRARITVGVRGYFVEGAKRIAECEVCQVLALTDEHSS